jgi:hypothetical protein
MPTLPRRTISLALSSRPYSFLFALPSERIVEPSNKIPAKSPREREWVRTSARITMSVSAKLYFAVHDGIGPFGIHHQEDELRGLAAQLESDVRPSSANSAGTLHRPVKCSPVRNVIAPRPKSPPTPNANFNTEGPGTLRPKRRFIRSRDPVIGKTFVAKTRSGEIAILLSNSMRERMGGRKYFPGIYPPEDRERDHDEAPLLIGKSRPLAGFKPTFTRSTAYMIALRDSSSCFATAVRTAFCSMGINWVGSTCSLA